MQYNPEIFSVFRGTVGENRHGRRFVMDGLDLFSLISKRATNINLKHMIFISRQQAGQKLAEHLKGYKGKKAVVYALPRGGVVLGVEVAKELKLPLDLLIPRKIGHPYNPEYAIAAVTESEVVSNEEEIKQTDPKWFEDEILKEQAEIEHRRKLYLGDRPAVDVKGKIAIVVDDGLATGLTMEVAVKELKKKMPKKIVVAVPVAPVETAMELGKLADDVQVLYFPSGFFGSVGSYYEDFPQVSDEEVINLMKSVNI